MEAVRDHLFAGEDRVSFGEKFPRLRPLVLLIVVV
jgi:hypothetical protein